jgi:hypothetical protein
MALGKNIPTNFGVDAAYWNIGEEHKDYRELSNRVVLYGYASEVARQAKAAPMSSAQVTIDKTAFDPDMTRAQIYIYIKANVDQFSDATDLL